MSDKQIEDMIKYLIKLYEIQENIKIDYKIKKIKEGETYEKAVEVAI